MSEGMKCPECGHAESRVSDSRNSERGIRRRRVCLGCGWRWTTYEIAFNPAVLGRLRQSAQRIRRDILSARDDLQHLDRLMALLQSAASPDTYSTAVDEDEAA